MRMLLAPSNRLESDSLLSGIKLCRRALGLMIRCRIYLRLNASLLRGPKVLCWLGSIAIERNLEANAFQMNVRESSSRLWNDLM